MQNSKTQTLKIAKSMTESVGMLANEDMLASFSALHKPRLEQCLAASIDQYSAPVSAAPPASQLIEAMRYSSLAGGKRIRAMLVYMAALACNDKSQSDQPSATTDIAATAVELIHCYSLIHDDLPAMDDDDLRRGKPSCHIQFDEATAILAGDALQSLAFELLSSHAEATAELRISLQAELSKAAGVSGMVGGQAIDLAMVDRKPDYDTMVQMHRLKTGALIEAATQMGCLCGAGSTEQSQALRQYAQAIGLAFQVVDDILDIEGNTAQLGKPQGADMEANKPTFPSIIGLDAAKQQAHSLFQQAITALESFGGSADPLRALAQFIIARQT